MIDNLKQRQEEMRDMIQIPLKKNLTKCRKKIINWRKIMPSF